MRLCLLTVSVLLCVLACSPSVKASESFPTEDGTHSQVFAATGVIQEIPPGAHTVVIQHEAISNYMAAMTMPFKVKDPAELAGLSRGDRVHFELHVGDETSWVAKIVKTGTVSLPPPDTDTAAAAILDQRYELLHYHFTNELGQPVSLSDFHGQALAITFFYTRCPLPDYCPRLSKNFAEVSRILKTMTNAPGNWHLISVSFDPEFDSPAMLKAYGDGYQYDSAHWSFLTGPQDKIAELARGAGMIYRSRSGTIDHNFRTLIVDASGHLQMVFPTGGNLSNQIVAEILKATKVKQ